MSNIIDHYIKRSVLFNILIVFLILLSISLIIKIIDELHNFEKNYYSIFKIFYCAFLKLPKDFDLFLQISVVLGSLLGLSVLEIHNELIIMQVSGLNKLQISISVIKISTFILLFNIISNEWLLPYSQKTINMYYDYNQYNTYLFPEKNKNLWLKDKNQYIYIENMLTTHNLHGINLFYLNKNKKIKKILHIEQAIYNKNYWTLYNIIELDLSNNTINKKKEQKQWYTILTPQLLSKIIIHPKNLPISELIYCIKYFNITKQNSNYYQYIVWNKILSPVVGILILITALLCNFGPFYQKKTSIKLFFGSIISLSFYISYQVIGTLSITYKINPFIGSMVPVTCILIINITIFWKYLQSIK